MERPAPTPVVTLAPPPGSTVVYTAHGFHFGASEPDGPAEWLFARFERLAGRWTDRLIVINDDDNATAQRLYDSTGAQHTTWIEYELPL